jgi:hypothetical protein
MRALQIYFFCPSPMSFSILLCDDYIIYFLFFSFEKRIMQILLNNSYFNPIKYSARKNLCDLQCSAIAAVSTLLSFIFTEFCSWISRVLLKLILILSKQKSSLLFFGEVQLLIFDPAKNKTLFLTLLLLGPVFSYSLNWYRKLLWIKNRKSTSYCTIDISYRVFMCNLLWLKLMY